MIKMLHVSDYQKWRRLADRITINGINEKKKAIRVFGEALKIMEDKKLQERFPDEWSIYKYVLKSYGVVLD
jgi:hypothetical protein